MEMQLKFGPVERGPARRKEKEKLRPDLLKRKLLHNMKTLEKQIRELERVEKTVSVQDGEKRLRAQAVVEEKRLEKITLVTKIKKRMMEIISLIIAFFKPRKVGARTRKGKRVLKQFKELAALYAVSVEMSPEETVAFDAAFGRTYYELLNVAKNASKRMEQEDAYVETMASFLNALT